MAVVFGVVPRDRPRFLVFPSRFRTSIHLLHFLIGPAIRTSLIHDVDDSPPRMPPSPATFHPPHFLRSRPSSYLTSATAVVNLRLHYMGAKEDLWSIPCLRYPPCLSIPPSSQFSPLATIFNLFIRAMKTANEPRIGAAHDRPAGIILSVPHSWTPDFLYFPPRVS
jgi:hypothetical protein